MEQQQRERWMHGRQVDRFSPFLSHRRWLSIDSIRDHATELRFFVTTSRNASGRDSALIVADPNGRILRYHAGLAPYRRIGQTYPGDSLRMIESRRFRDPIALSLALVETRSWDLVPGFPRNPVVGMQWKDTIGREAIDGPYRQTLFGTRTSQILRDTSIAGRQLWVVRDSAHVRYDERFLERERTLDTTAQISRTATGVERGVHLFDPAVGLFRWRHDTLLLRGEAVLRYPDGRSYRTPATYERSRLWTLRDSVEHAARQKELRADMQRNSGGMVVVPSPLQRRIAEGDTAARDSLLIEWQHTADARVADDIFRTLLRWSGRDLHFRAVLDSMRVAEGDTAYLYKHLADRAYAQAPTDTADLRRMLPFMEDPGLAWGFNLSRDWLYENLAQSLTTWPPAAANGDDRLACTPAACRLLGSRWRSAKERRTRDVALVALFAMDPARWADTVLRHASSNASLLNAAIQLARGVGANWPASSKRAMAAPTSDWRAWLEWMNGEDSTYARIHAANAARYGWPRDTVKRPRFEESHRVAIRMYAKQTGRDIVAELRHGYEAARSERERLVFGTMLRGLGEFRMTADEIVSEFRAVAPERAKLARGALMDLFAREARPLDSTQATALLDRLIASIVEAWPLWPPGAADMGPASAGRPELHARRGRVRLSADHLPSALIEKWGKKVEIVGPGHRDQIDPREATVIYTVSPVTGVGSFAKVEMRAAEQLARPADHAPAHYASATTYFLMNRDGEWVIVAVSGWVT